MTTIENSKNICLNTQTPLYILVLEASRGLMIHRAFPGENPVTYINVAVSLFTKCPNEDLMESIEFLCARSVPRIPFKAGCQIEYLYPEYPLYYVSDALAKNIDAPKVQIDLTCYPDVAAVNSAVPDGASWEQFLEETGTRLFPPVESSQFGQSMNDHENAEFSAANFAFNVEGIFLGDDSLSYCYDCSVTNCEASLVEVPPLMTSKEDKEEWETFLTWSPDILKGSDEPHNDRKDVPDYEGPICQALAELRAIHLLENHSRETECSKGIRDEKEKEKSETPEGTVICSGCGFLYSAFTESGKPRDCYFCEDMKKNKKFFFNNKSTTSCKQSL